MSDNAASTLAALSIAVLLAAVTVLALLLRDLYPYSQAPDPGTVYVDVNTEQCIEVSQ